jgi:hypothetical protein
MNVSGAQPHACAYSGDCVSIFSFYHLGSIERAWLSGITMEKSFSLCDISVYDKFISKALGVILRSQAIIYSTFTNAA